MPKTVTDKISIFFAKNLDNLSPLPYNFGLISD